MTPSDPVKLFLCGDVMTGRGIDQILPHPCEPRLHEQSINSALGYVRLAEAVTGPIPRPVDMSYVWGAALEELNRARPDVRIVNLETSVTRSESWVDKGINYRMSPDNAGCLRAAGIDCCVLANNHVLDWGAAGLIETLATLETRGIKTAGAGRDASAAAEPAILDIPGKGRVIVHAFGHPSSGIPHRWAARSDALGINLLPDFSDASVTLIRRRLAEIRRPGDVMVLSIHWGGNWGYGIPPEHRRFAHAIVDEAGVSMVHGHSSHHVKAIEVYRGRLILYGCGDFLNDYEGISGYEEFRGDLALMYFASVDAASGGLVELDLTPLQIRHFQLARAAPEDVNWLKETLNRTSREFATRIVTKPDGRLAAAWR
jgi:poly-gamma-glutamate synthesis protein (capsule biosynthesis protein)